jgi:hypothetical protein
MQPSVADYTETVVTEDRVKEGRFWQSIGCLMLVFAVVSFTVSMCVTNFNVVQKQMEQVVRWKSQLPMKCTEDVADECNPDWFYNFQIASGMVYPPRYNKFYLFNVANKAAVLTGARPILQESGPYVFREMEARVNIVFNADNSEVT